jgi:hypothetical protein
MAGVKKSYAFKLFEYSIIPFLLFDKTSQGSHDETSNSV